MKWRPKRADVGLVYICDCGEESYSSVEEAVVPNFKIRCGCGKVWEVDQIVNVNVKCYYQTKFPSDNQKQAIKILQSQGYRGCYGLVQKVGDGPVQEIVKKAVLRYAKTTTA